MRGFCLAMAPMMDLRHALFGKLALQAHVEYHVKTYQEFAEGPERWKRSVRCDLTFIVHVVLT